MAQHLIIHSSRVKRRIKDRGWISQISDQSTIVRLTHHHRISDDAIYVRKWKWKRVIIPVDTYTAT